MGRTLVLPFLFTYGSWEQSKMYPYESLFSVESVHMEDIKACSYPIRELQKYTDVITMDDFMHNIAPHIWPESERVVHCHWAFSSQHGRCFDTPSWPMAR